MATLNPSTGENKETMRLLIRILQRCDYEKRQKYLQHQLKDHLKRVEYYTGLNKNTLSVLSKQKNIWFAKCYEMDRNTIHNELMTFYLVKEILPTTRELYDVLSTKIPMHIDIGKLRRLLVKMGYYWKSLPSKKLIILEKPSITFERYTYLKNIIKYRSTDMPIYFIGENYMSIDKTCRTTQDNFNNLVENLDVVKMSDSGTLRFVTYAASKTGIYCMKLAATYGKLPFEDYVTEYLAPMPTPSVFVIRNTPHNTNEEIILPTKYGLKIEMVEWLEYHGIPCHPNMSKSELYSLIERYTNTTEKLYKIDAILKTYGHVVLRIPECINRLTLAYLVGQLINQNSCDMIPTQAPNDYLESLLEDIISHIPSKTLTNYDSYICEEENKLLENDKNLDDILDVLVQQASINVPDKPVHVCEDSDFASCSDSD